MRTRQGAVLQSLRRARGFLDEHEPTLNLASSETRKALDEVITQLSDQAVVQDNGARGSRGETERQRSARMALRLYHMRPISEIAKLKLRDVPESASLRMPPFSARAESLAAAADSMADAAAKYEKVLIANGLPATFIADLRAAGAALRASVDGRGDHQRRRSGATVGLLLSERRGRAMLKVLDGIVLARVGVGTLIAGEWTAARRIQRVTVLSAKDDPEATPPAPPTPVVTGTSAA